MSLSPENDDASFKEAVRGLLPSWRRLSKELRPARVELATCGLGNRRSILLSYGRSEEEVYGESSVGTRSNGGGVP